MKKWHILVTVLIFCSLLLTPNQWASGTVEESSEASQSFHVVVKGETVWQIANEYQLTAEELRQMNQLISDKIYVGQKLKINLVSESQSTLPNTNPLAAANKRGFTSHIVKTNETLWRIATKHQMTVAELKELNQLHTDQISIGQILQVKQPEAEESTVLENEKVIALTFDDGPSSSVTPRILDILDQYNVKATFFVLGQKAEINPAIIKREIQEGHEIGNHTFSHPVLTKLSENEANQQVESTNRIIQSIADYQVKLLRPPYGVINERLIAAYQMPVIEWSVDTEDWKSKNADAVYQEVLRKSNSGAIILMHDIHPTSADALAPIIQTLKGQGYKFVTVSELCNGVLSGNKSYYQANDIR